MRKLYENIWEYAEELHPRASPPSPQSQREPNHIEFLIGLHIGLAHWIAYCHSVIPPCSWRGQVASLISDVHQNITCEASTNFPRQNFRCAPVHTSMHVHVQDPSRKVREGPRSLQQIINIYKMACFIHVSIYVRCLFSLTCYWFVYLVAL